MKIESITVGYGITQSLPDYCNIKPSLTLTARIDEGEDALKVEQFLFDHAKVVLHELVDRALEADGMPARYALGPRFQLVKTRYDDGYSEKIFSEQCIALIPDACERPSGYVGASYRGCTHLRYEHAVRLAGELAKEQELEVAWIDCSDGDLSRLPVWQARDKEKEAGAPDRADESTFLRWFYTHADFGPSDSDVQNGMKAQFQNETGLLLPEGYTLIQDEDAEDDGLETLTIDEVLDRLEDDTEILGTDADLGGWE